LQQSEDKII